MVLSLMIAFGGYVYWSPRRIRENDVPLPPAASLDRAIVVGKSQSQTETFQGIPYAQPPWVTFARNRV